MKSRFEIGQRVVCVDDGSLCSRPGVTWVTERSRIVRGRVYEIRGHVPDWICQAVVAFGYAYGPAVYLVGRFKRTWLLDDWCDTGEGTETGYADERFAPLGRGTTNIEIFERMLREKQLEDA